MYSERLTKHICTRIVLDLCLENSRRFASSCYLSMWDEPAGSRADGFRRSPLARSFHLAVAEFGFPVLAPIKLDPFIADVPSSSVLVSLKVAVSGKAFPYCGTPMWPYERMY